LRWSVGSARQNGIANGNASVPPLALLRKRAAMTRVDASSTGGTRLAEEQGMRIERWMKHPVVTVKPRDSAAHARAVMSERRINQLSVVAGANVVGIVTDRDLRDAFPSVYEDATGHGRSADPATIPVEDLMSPAVFTLPSDAQMADAALLMRRERIGAIPIVDGGRLRGILTRSDVLDAFVESSGRSPDA
jgi:acetoin utilization protein AcuB